MKSNTKGSLILILCSFIWGMCFSAQSNASRFIGPFTFVCLRSFLTSVVLFGVYPLLNRLSGKRKSEDKPAFTRKDYLRLGGILGLILVSATTLQQAGLNYTTAAKSGFITALYIVMIPVIGLFMGRRTGKLVWLGVGISLVGLCLLCLQDDLRLNIGDVITLLCALVFAFHIIVIDRYAGEMDSILLSAIQFGVGALITFPIMMILEKPALGNIWACFGSILYAAVMSGAIGYTLQFVGQKYTEPTLASLLMCLESVFSAFGGWIILGQVLSGRELLGCALMLAASVVAQLPEKKKLTVG